MRPFKFYICTALVCLSAAIFAASCKKNDHASPAAKETATATMTNAHDSTFTFSASTTTNVVAGMDKDTVAMVFVDDKTGTMLEFAAYPITKTGTYSFQDGTDLSCYAIMALDGGLSLDGYYTSGTDVDGDNTADGTGSLTISTLTHTRIAGTFSMTMYNANLDKMTVTHGKFDCAITQVP